MRLADQHLRCAHPLDFAAADRNGKGAVEAAWLLQDWGGDPAAGAAACRSDRSRGDALKLARGVRAALDKTAVVQN
jgi:hypothetical protein